MWLVVTLIIIASYLLGSIPSGLLISKSQGLDIREHGSRNIGATNVWRTMGKKWGILAFFGDTFKGWLAVVIGFWIATRVGYDVPVARGRTVVQHMTSDYAGITAAMGCILGHNFPIWLRFKGGKGVATSLGVIIGMMPFVSIIIFAVWGIVLKLSRYVSLASIIAALSLPITVIALMFIGPREGWAAIHGWGNFYFACVAAILVVKRHTANIKRLIDGTELRFGDPKPAPDAPPPEPPPTTPTPGAN
jgi:acyl phosphate:glycerol-3-phosphate acyltransferase